MRYIVNYVVKINKITFKIAKSYNFCHLYCVNALKKSYQIFRQNASPKQTGQTVFKRLPNIKKRKKKPQQTWHFPNGSVQRVILFPQSYKTQKKPQKRTWYTLEKRKKPQKQTQQKATKQTGRFPNIRKGEFGSAFCKSAK